jgi:predicted nucleotidyltransferase
MLLKRNGYVLEQLYSPLVVTALPEHEQLKQIARKCMTRHHVHHYLGFAQTQWGLFEKESPPRIKPLLYIYRVLLTGMHLMRTGEVEANLAILNERLKLPFIPDLMARKTAGSEQELLSDSEKTFHRQEFEQLWAELELAGTQSNLPESPKAQTELNALLVALRLEFLRY